MLMGMSKRECVDYAKKVGAHSVSYFENKNGIPQMIIILFAKGGYIRAWFDHHSRRVSEERLYH